jgi:hypothetical protein
MTEIAKFVRLKNGDDLITQVVETGLEDDYVYNLISPLKVLYMQTSRPGYIQVAMVPWVLPRICDAPEFTIDPDDVLLLSNASAQISEYYWETIGDDKNDIGVEMAEQEEPEPPYEEATEEEIEDMIHDIKRTYH